jgi:hypothetical protein
VRKKIEALTLCPGFPDARPIVECPSMRACYKAKVGDLAPGARWFVPRMVLEQEMLGLDVGQ